MREAALLYTRSSPDWPSEDQIGMFLHVYAHCSVNSLHLHIVDLSEVGPTYEACRYKNLSMDMVLKALEDEIKEFKGVKIMKSAKRLFTK